MAKEQEKSGAATTATDRKENAVKSLARHVKKLQKAKNVCAEITALKKIAVDKIIGEEITKTIDLMRKAQEKELQELIKGE